MLRASLFQPILACTLIAESCLLGQFTLVELKNAENCHNVCQICFPGGTAVANSMYIRTKLTQNPPLLFSLALNSSQFALKIRFRRVLVFFWVTERSRSCATPANMLVTATLLTASTPLCDRVCPQGWIQHAPLRCRRCRWCCWRWLLVHPWLTCGARS